MPRHHSSSEGRGEAHHQHHRGGGGGGHRSRQDNTKVSKSLSWLLRHGAGESGITLTQDGYADWADICKLQRFRGVSVETVERIVADCRKQRFKLIRDPNTGATLIRANQGHTVTTVDAEKLLTPLTLADLDSYPYVVHGTTAHAWPMIKNTGLNKMGRNHIHFAIGLPKDAGVISGMRASSAVLIELDLAKVLAAGNIPMYISTNKVILSPGLNGSPGQRPNPFPTKKPLSFSLTRGTLVVVHQPPLLEE